MGKFKVGDNVKHEDGSIGIITELGNGPMRNMIQIQWSNNCSRRFWRYEDRFIIIPDTPSWLPLEVGKFYRLRGGYKYQFHCNSKNSGITIGEYYAAREDRWLIVVHYRNGNWTADGSEYSLDIIGPWIDRPTMDFSVLPKWAKSVAMEEDGVWWWHSYRPYKIGHSWKNDGLHGRIPPAYAPHYDGSWEESLVVKED